MSHWKTEYLFKIKMLRSLYNDTFEELVLPPGTTCYANLSNGIDSGVITGSSYSFSLANGTYSYTVSSVYGYSISLSSGSITVSGSSIAKTITYTSTPTHHGEAPSSGILSIELYSLIGAIVVMAAIGSGIIVFRRGR